MSTIDNTHVKRSRYPYLVDEIGDACASPVDGGKVEGYIHALEPKIRGCRGCGEAMISHRGEVLCRFCRSMAV